LNTFFALLDFGRKDEERRAKGERRGEAEDGRRTTDEGRTTSDKLDTDKSAFCPKTKNSLPFLDAD
jgi:hypothetical protein